MSTNTIMFPGSSDLYISYHDILGTPQFMLLLELARGIKYPGLYDTNIFSAYTIEELIRWYLYRPKKNFLNLINANGFTEEENDSILYHALLEMNTYSSFIPVNLYEALIVHPIVDNIHVYTEKNEPLVQKELAYFGKNLHVQYEYGKFEDIISIAKDQCTLVTTSTQEMKTFMAGEYRHRYTSLIYPNEYDSIKNISDVYSIYAGKISVIDIRSRVEIWKESIT